MTDLIHVEDLTTNTTRFDMLDEDTRLRLAALGPHERQYWSGRKWHKDDEAILHTAITYRQKPKPETVVRYSAVYDFGFCVSWDKLADAKRVHPEALSFIRIETCTKTGQLISAENVEVGDE